MEEIKFLKELQTELKTQEHDCQAAPRFWVIMDHVYQITAEGYHDRVSVYDPNGSESYEIGQYAKSLLEDEDSDLTSEAISELKSIMADYEDFDENELIEWIESNCDDLTVFYEKEEGVIKQDTFFLTKQEAKDHLKSNSHHYSSKAHTYAMTAWRAPKVARLFSILEAFDWQLIEKALEAVRCGECRKMMTKECYMCSFDKDGHCTGGPDNDQFCSFGEKSLDGGEQDD